MSGDKFRETNYGTQKEESYKNVQPLEARADPYILNWELIT